VKGNIALLGAKMAQRASRMIGKGGGNIPGVVAKKIDPSLLHTLAKQVENVIVITGTNGKTTTSNLLAGILREDGEDVVHNAEGNNLLSGVTTSFIMKANINKKMKKKYKYAVLEVDEANVPLVVSQVNPKFVIVNNFFRDQLNRYGEIDTLVEKIKGAVQKTKATLVLNGDDPFVMRIGLSENKKVYFGLMEEAYAFDQYSMNESKFCPTCGKELMYSYVHYGQLGFYKCSCGFERPKAKYEVAAISDDMTFSIKKETYQLGIGGTYNVYNALGAIACAKEFGIEELVIKKALKDYQATNGRMQEFQIGNSLSLLNLAKNQVGADISISEMVKGEESKQILFVLNDLAHDSEDISWIWDADFERLTKANISRIICSGTRADDMALRVSYAGVDKDKIVVIPNMEMAVDEAIKMDGKTFMLPTYTGLIPIRKHLIKKQAIQEK
jgi:lipid II isoglutaminyl synthase (glutamine-hydrolysing)